MDDKTLGRLLHDRLSAAFDGFSLENGTIPANVVLAAFLSGAVKAILVCPCVEMRKALVSESIKQLIEQGDVPLAALVQDVSVIQDKMLAHQKPAGRA